MGSHEQKVRRPVSTGLIAIMPKALPRLIAINGNYAHNSGSTKTSGDFKRSREH